MYTLCYELLYIIFSIFAPVCIGCCMNHRKQWLCAISYSQGCFRIMCMIGAAVDLIAHTTLVRPTCTHTRSGFQLKPLRLTNLCLQFYCFSTPQLSSLVIIFYTFQLTKQNRGNTKNSLAIKTLPSDSKQNKSRLTVRQLWFPDCPAAKRIQQLWTNRIT